MNTPNGGAKHSAVFIFVVSKMYVVFENIVGGEYVFRVIIAGGRDFNDYQLLRRTMDNLLCNITEDIIVVCGQAKGADTLGEQYAKEKGYTIDYYPANWKLYGKRAGFLRNEQVAQNADALVAFWNGESRGTKNMIELAKRYGLKMRIKQY